MRTRHGAVSAPTPPQHHLVKRGVSNAEDENGSRRASGAPPDQMQLHRRCDRSAIGTYLVARPETLTKDRRCAMPASTSRPAIGVLVATSGGMDESPELSEPRAVGSTVPD